MSGYWAIKIDRETGNVVRKEFFEDKDEAYLQANYWEGPGFFTTVVRRKSV